MTRPCGVGVVPGVHRGGGADHLEQRTVGLDGGVPGGGQGLHVGVIVGDVGGITGPGGRGDEQQPELVAGVEARGDQRPILGHGVGAVGVGARRTVDANLLGRRELAPRPAACGAYSVAKAAVVGDAPTRRASGVIGVRSRVADTVVARKNRRGVHVKHKPVGGVRCKVDAVAGRRERVRSVRISSDKGGIRQRSENRVIRMSIAIALDGGCQRIRKASAML